MKIVVPQAVTIWFTVRFSQYNTSLILTSYIILFLVNEMQIQFGKLLF